VGAATVEVPRAVEMVKESGVFGKFVLLALQLTVLPGAPAFRMGMPCESGTPLFCRMVKRVPAAAT
jgi:hypothetical protein